MTPSQSPTHTFINTYTVAPMSSAPVESSFEISLVLKGHSQTLSTSASATGSDLYGRARDAFHLADGTTEVKLLYKGKRIVNANDHLPFHGVKSTKKPLKIVVMATQTATIDDVKSKQSDPTIRGFDQEHLHSQKRRQQHQQTLHWAENMVQSKDYKFCRFQECRDQSFGHRGTDQTPHAFAARQLLEKMATDPGIVAIMKERELVVGTLGEMDPIDDRLMLKKQQDSGGGACLLGYNTNGGSRIDIKLRTDDLTTFRPYSDLVSTLIHELSHNWVGEHNLLFWTNYAQMRAEYIFTHARLLRSSLLIRGKTTAELAGLDRTKLNNVYTFIMAELVGEMAQHGLHPNMIQAPIQQRIQELEVEDSLNQHQGHRLGGSIENDRTNGQGGTNANDARERALAAAERRAREQKEGNMEEGDTKQE